MGRYLLSVLFIIFSIPAFTQTPVIIDDPVNGGFQVPMKDTIISSYDQFGCGTHEYFLDLDGDSVPDVGFWLHCYIGGMGSNSDIAVTSYGGFGAVVDTAFMSPVSYIDSTGNIADTILPFVVADRFSSGDTVPPDLPSQQDKTTILSISTGNFPTLIYFRKIDHFIGDTCFIAFYKQDGPDTWIYYLKVFVENKYKIRLMAARTNDIKLTVPPVQPSPVLVYPNPAAGFLTIAGDVEKAGIYAVSGILLNGKTTIPNGGELTMDVSALPDGIYFARVQMKDGRITWQKVIVKR